MYAHICEAVSGKVSCVRDREAKVEKSRKELRKEGRKKGRKEGEGEGKGGKREGGSDKERIISH